VLNRKNAKIQVHAYIVASSAAQAAADLAAMTAAHTNKTLQLEWMETREP
jgi:hypothetical protein